MSPTRYASAVIEGALGVSGVSRASGVSGATRGVDVGGVTGATVVTMTTGLTSLLFNSCSTFKPAKTPTITSAVAVATSSLLLIIL